MQCELRPRRVRWRGTPGGPLWRGVAGGLLLELPQGPVPGGEGQEPPHLIVGSGTGHCSDFLRGVDGWWWWCGCV